MTINEIKRKLAYDEEYKFLRENNCLGPNICLLGFGGSHLNYGASLGNYVNSHIGFLLKDIIRWCLNNPEHSLANNLIKYIHENKLDIEENMEKEFVVNSIPYKEFAERGVEEEYMKYMGYSMYCID